jgi:hypothetical protein
MYFQVNLKYVHWKKLAINVHQPARIHINAATIIVPTQDTHVIVL